MSKKLEQSTNTNASADTDASADNGQRALKIAIIAFAIIEALVLIPVVLRMISR